MLLQKRKAYSVNLPKIEKAFQENFDCEAHFWFSYRLAGCNSTKTYFAVDILGGFSTSLKALSECR